MAGRIPVYVYTAVDGYAWQGCGGALASSLQSAMEATGTLPGASRTGTAPVAGGAIRCSLLGRPGVAAYRHHLNTAGDFRGRESHYVALAFFPSDGPAFDLARVWSAPAMSAPASGPLDALSLAPGEWESFTARKFGSPGLDTAAPGSSEPTVWTESFRRTFSGPDALSSASAAFADPASEGGALSCVVERDPDGFLRAEVSYEVFPEVAAVRSAHKAWLSLGSGRDDGSLFGQWEDAADKLSAKANRIGAFRTLSAFAKTESATVAAIRVSGRVPARKSPATPKSSPFVFPARAPRPEPTDSVSPPSRDTSHPRRPRRRSLPWALLGAVVGAVIALLALSAAFLLGGKDSDGNDDFGNAIDRMFFDSTNGISACQDVQSKDMPADAETTRKHEAETALANMVSGIARVAEDLRLRRIPKALSNELSRIEKEDLPTLAGDGASAVAQAASVNGVEQEFFFMEACRKLADATNGIPRQIEKRRSELAKKAAEEAARIAREDAERIAREEAERKEAERITREKEEANQKAEEKQKPQQETEEPKEQEKDQEEGKIEVKVFVASAEGSNSRKDGNEEVVKVNEPIRSQPDKASIIAPKRDGEEKQGTIAENTVAEDLQKEDEARKAQEKADAEARRRATTPTDEFLRDRSKIDGLETEVNRLVGRLGDEAPKNAKARSKTAYERKREGFQNNWNLAALREAWWIFTDLKTECDAIVAEQLQREKDAQEAERKAKEEKERKNKAEKEARDFPRTIRAEAEKRRDDVYDRLRALGFSRGNSEAWCKFWFDKAESWIREGEKIPVNDPGRTGGEWVGNARAWMTSASNEVGRLEQAKLQAEKAKSDAKTAFDSKEKFLDKSRRREFRENYDSLVAIGDQIMDSVDKTAGLDMAVILKINNHSAIQQKVDAVRNEFEKARKQYEKARDFCLGQNPQPEPAPNPPPEPAPEPSPIPEKPATNATPATAP